MSLHKRVDCDTQMCLTDPRCFRSNLQQTLDGSIYRSSYHQGSYYERLLKTLFLSQLTRKFVKDDPKQLGSRLGRERSLKFVKKHRKLRLLTLFPYIFTVCSNVNRFLFLVYYYYSYPHSYKQHFLPQHSRHYMLCKYVKLYK